MKKSSFSNAQTYCKSIGGIIAKINDILEIQDILPESIINIRLLNILPHILYRHHYSFNDTIYFWVNRTLDIPDNNTISERLLGKCSQSSETTDKNCLVVHYEKIPKDNTTTHQLCIAESKQCSIKLASPVCVDQHLEKNSTFIPINSDNISSNISIDYSCGDDNEYYFVDDYCYKIFFHETSWKDAKSECENDNAMLFVPEKSITLQIIKYLFLRQSSYTSSGFAHVGVMYDNQNRTVIENNTIIPDSNAVYDLCEKTFHERYTAVMSSPRLTINEKNQIKKQQIGCAYIDLLSYTAPIIRCDEIPCNRIATVICQKLPNIKTDVIRAKRLVF
jgi:hypothetical protein